MSGADPTAMTLVKFDGPVLVQNEQRKNKDDAFFYCKTFNSVGSNWNPDPNTISLCQDTGTKKKELEQVLNTIVAPMLWEDDGRTWKYVVSNEPATRADIIYLHRELDHRLNIRQARTEGICPIRRELYTQAFDELIRQVTTACPERGLLLLRVRDELKMTINSYQALNDDSSGFGVTNLADTNTQRRLNLKFKQMALNKKYLERKLRNLKDELQLIRRTFEEKRISDDKRHFEQVQFLKRVNQLLREKFVNLGKVRFED